MSRVMMVTLEHRNILAAYYIHKKPGLDSVLKALKLHREKTNGALPPSDSFKKPLWMWSLKKERMSFRPWFSNRLWHFCLEHKTSKKTWYHSSYGKNETRIFVHVKRWLKYSFSARTNSEFVRATSDTFNAPMNWYKAIKHCKNQCKMNIFKFHFNNI